MKNQFEFEFRKPNLKRSLAMVLSCCMLFSALGDMNMVMAAELDASEVEQSVSDSVEKNTLARTATPDITPDIDIAPDEDRVYAENLSDDRLVKNIGEDAIFKVYASSEKGEELSYTWYGPDDRVIEGLTGDTCTIRKITEQDFGEYYCRVSNGSKKRTVWFELRKNRQLYFVNYTQSDDIPIRYAYVNEQVVIDAEAIDYTNPDAQLTYTWYVEKGNNIWGETEYEELTTQKTAVYTFQASADSGKKHIKCIASNGNDTISMKWYIETVDEGYDVYFRDKHANIGDTGITFRVNEEYMNGISPDVTPVYRWAKYTPCGSEEWEWEYIESEEVVSNQYTFDTVGEKDYGEYKCVVMNEDIPWATYYFTLSSCGSAWISGFKDTDENAKLNQKIGDSVTLAVKNDFIDNQKISYQWQKVNKKWDEFEDISGANSSQYRIQILSEDDLNEYRCVVMHGKEQILLPINIYTERESFIVLDESSSQYIYTLPGQKVDMESHAFYGGKELIYQWYVVETVWESEQEIEEERIIYGANQQTYSVTPQVENDFQNYRCKITCPETEETRYTDFEIIKEKKAYLQIDSYNEPEEGYIFGDTLKLNAKFTDEFDDLILEEVSYNWNKIIFNETTEEKEVFPISGEVESEYQTVLQSADDLNAGYQCVVIYKGEKYYADYTVKIKKLVDWGKTDICLEQGESYTIEPIVKDKNGNTIDDGYSCRFYKPGQEDLSREFSYTVSRAGNYCCEVSYQGMVWEQQYHVSVNTGFRWLDLQEEVYVKPGREFILQAEAVCDTELTYKWLVCDLYGKMKIVEGETLETLCIKDVADLGDNYIVFCEATDEYGNIYSKRFVICTLEESEEINDFYFAMDNVEYVPLIGENLSIDVTLINRKGVDYSLSLYKYDDIADMYKLVGTGEADKSLNLGVVTESTYGNYMVIAESEDDRCRYRFSVENVMYTHTIDEMNQAEESTMDYRSVVYFYNVQDADVDGYHIVFDRENIVANRINIYEIEKNGKVSLVDSYYKWEIPEEGIVVNSSRFVIDAVAWGPVKVRIASITPLYYAETINLNQSQLKLKIKDTEVLTATIAPVDVDSKKLAWTSSNTEVAYVSGNGKVIARAAGTTTITATALNGVAATCQVTVTSDEVRETQILLSKSTLSLTTGNKQTLTASVLPADASDKNVNWTSSNTKVATVADGVVSAIAAGTATITATTANGLSASCNVTVTAPVYKVTEITMSKTTFSMKKGETTRLTATISPANATNKNITWKSSNTKVATVTNGVVTAVNAGTANITATTEDGAKVATCKVTVTIPATSLTITKKLSIVKGKKAKLTAVVKPIESTDKITWSTSNKKVATVDQKGNVKGIKAGTANITATASSGKKVTCKVTVVNKKIPATKVKLNKKKATIKAGSSVTLKATMSPTKTTDIVKWTTSNKKIAKVDQNGKVTGVKKGTATITAKTSSGKTAKCKITVKKK